MIADDVAKKRALLPWQSVQWQALGMRISQNNLPHALLLVGARGLGKNHFAECLAQALFCNKPQADGLACHACRSCLLYIAGNHPDHLRVEPEEEGKAIAINQLRDMNAMLTLKSQYTGYRVVIISPAEQMTLPAANSLLKILEEPPALTLLVLITSQPGLLLPTVRSRCQHVNFIRPATRIAEPWLRARINPEFDPAQLLALAHGAPCAALNLAASDILARRMDMLADLESLSRKQADPVRIAEKWLKWGLKESLDWMLNWVTDMIRLHSADQPHYLANSDVRQRLQSLAKPLSFVDLYGTLDCVNEALSLANRQLSGQLLLEDVLISWIRHSADWDG